MRGVRRCARATMRPRRGGEAREEFLPSHSITSSAAASNGGRHFEAERGAPS